MFVYGLISKWCILILQKITPFVEVFFFHFLQSKQGLDVERKGCKDAFVHNYNNVIMCQAMKLCYHSNLIIITPINY